jgi:hypothetical protein
VFEFHFQKSGAHARHSTSALLCAPTEACRSARDIAEDAEAQQLNRKCCTPAVEAAITVVPIGVTPAESNHQEILTALTLLSLLARIRISFSPCAKGWLEYG